MLRMRRHKRFSGFAVCTALVMFGWHVAAAEVPPTPVTPERATELSNLLLHDCGSCHGLTMKGGLGPPLLPARLAEFEDADLIDVILEGRPGTPMPPWAPEITREDAAWLVQRLKAGANP